MKSFLLLVAFLCALTLSSSAPSVTSAANAAKKERATMNFREPIQVMGVVLKGEYLFVHNDDAMAQGEACTYIYRGLDELPRNLVVAFHCTPATRDKVAHFTTRAVTTSSGQRELKEFQFAGSTEAHLVPVHHGDYVTMAIPD